MKKRILLFATLSNATLFAADPDASLINTFHPAVKNGSNVWIQADVLYWKPWERALVATNHKSDVFVTDDFTKASVARPHFEWSLGYRLNAGYLFPAYHWDVGASWTHYTSHLSQHKSSHGSAFLGMFPIRSLSDDIFEGDYVFDSQLKWKLIVNMLDVQFGRYFTVFHRLDLKPYCSLRNAWIKQHGRIAYQGGIFLIGILAPGVSLNGTDLIKMKNNYWGMGPRIGIAPRLAIGKGFGLNADAAISALYGIFSIAQKETYLDKTRFSYHKHLDRFCFVGDLLAGVEWKAPFCNERYALTFKADWEYHIFSRQFKLRKDRFDLVSHHRDLSMQGLTFSTRFDF